MFKYNKNKKLMRNKFIKILLTKFSNKLIIFNFKITVLLNKKQMK